MSEDTILMLKFKKFRGIRDAAHAATGDGCNPTILIDFLNN